jgi:proliferating cell nuclear antigen
MFNLKIPANPFRTYLLSLETILDEITFEASSDGIIIKGMDASRVAMFDVAFPSNLFENYECPKPTKFTVNSTSISRLLKRATETDSLEPSLNEDSKKLAVSFEDVATRRFSLRLLESGETQTCPKLKYTTKVVLKTKQFLQFLLDADLITDYVKLMADAKHFTVESIGDLGEATLELNKDRLVALDCPQPQKEHYSLSYMLQIVKILADVCETVTLNWDTDMPLLVEFTLSPPGRLWWYIAPRIETE